MCSSDIINNKSQAWVLKVLHKQNVTVERQTIDTNPRAYLITMLTKIIKCI